jgi:hypothetical protein
MSRTDFQQRGQQRDTDIKPIKTSNLVPVAASDLTTLTTLDWVRQAEFAIRSGERTHEFAYYICAQPVRMRVIEVGGESGNM